ncbi:MAG: DNA mismatch repair protein MutL, partial [Cyclobacteriaceae bacterium]
AEAPMGGPGTPDSTPAFQFQQKYIVWPVAEGLMLIDQEAAHERILYEKFQQHLRNRSGASQQSLFPQSVVLAPADFALIMEIMPELTALGFRLEEFGKNTVLVTGIPVDGTAHEKHLLDGLLEQFKSNQSTLQLPVGDNLARSLARRTGIRPGQKLGATEINSLVTRLFQCAAPSLAADGRPTFFILDTSKIERYFGR